MNPEANPVSNELSALLTPLAVLTHAPAQSVLALAVLPFLPGDALKIAAAAALPAGFQRLRRRTA